MEPTRTLAPKGGYNLSLGLGSGYDSASLIKQGTVTLNSGHIRRASIWAKEFRGGVRPGVESMLRSLLIENGGGFPGRLAADGHTGPTITPEQFSERVIIPLLVTYSGLLMDTKQVGALRALMSLVSVMHLPEVMPMTVCDFKMRFKSTGQMLAQPGRMTSRVGGVGSDFFDIDFSMSKYVTGFPIGDQELFYESDPSQVITALAEKMASLETNWGLTSIHLHACYAARQPSLQQLMLMNNTLHQPETNVIAKLMQVFFMDHILCGALNRSDSNFIGVLTSLTEMMESTAGEIVVLVPKRVMDSGKLRVRRKKVSVNQQRYLYNANRASGMSGYALFGTTSNDPYNDPQAIVPHAVGGTYRTPVNLVTDDGPEPVGEQVEVDAISLANGQEVSIITVTGGTGNDQSVECDAALKQRCVKRLFFTVGGCPDAYQKFCNPGFFGKDVTGKYKQAMSCSPGSTYYMDYDNNKIAKITMRELHVKYAEADLFNTDFAMQDWRKSFPQEYVGYVDEDATAELLFTPKETREKSRLLMFEINPRFMMLTAIADIQAIRNRFPLNVAPARFVYYTPRVVLGNASPCSSFENEIVCSVGGMAQMFKDVTENLTTFLEETSRELQMVDFNAVVAARAVVQIRADDGTLTSWLKTIVSGKGVLTDPIVQVKFMESMLVVMNQQHSDTAVAAADAFVAANPPGNPPPLLPPVNHNLLYMQYITANMEFLVERYRLISRAYTELTQLIGTLYQSDTYNLILAAAPLIDCPGAILLRYPQALKWLYGIGLPALTNRVFVANNYVATNALAGININVANDFTLHASAGVYVGQGVDRPVGCDEIQAYKDDNVNGISVVRKLFHTRHEALLKQFACCPMIKALALTHYWTVWNEETMANHFDRHYFSGLSYLVVRHMKYTGYTMACMPVRGTRLLLGNRAFAFPLSTWQATQYNQTLSMGFAPMDLNSLGITVQNFYIDEITGLSSNFDVNTKPRDCALVLDSYNSFLPEGLSSYQPDLGLLSLHGRFDGSMDRKSEDVVTGCFTYLPTSHAASSSLLRLANRAQQVVAEDSSLGLMQTAIKTGSFVAGVPNHVYTVAENGISAKDVLSKIVATGEIPPHLFNAKFGGMFTDDYTVGEGSSAQLRGAAGLADLDLELQPRICSIGGINANAVFGQVSTDPKFMNAFVKQVEATRLNLARAF